MEYQTSCVHCKNKDKIIKKMRTKLETNKKLLNELDEELSILESKYGEAPERDEHNFVEGRTNKIVTSDLGESYLFLDGDQIPKVGDLDIRERQIINRQNSYSKYDKVIEQINKINNFTTFGAAVVGIFRIFLPI